MNISEVNLFVHSDLAHDGYDEDGSPIISEWYYVVAEDAKGYRLAHCQSVADRDLAEEAMDRLIDAGGVLESSLWTPIDPAYGSEAYLEIEPSIVAREREEEYA